MTVYANCHILLLQNIKWYEYIVINLSSELISITELEVSGNDQLCQECLNLVLREAASRSVDPNHHSERAFGHSCVCVCCGLSLTRRSGRRRHRLASRSEARTYIENQIFPRTVPEEAWVCHACWMRAYVNLPMREIIEIPPMAFFEPPSDRNEQPEPQQVELDSSVPPSLVPTAQFRIKFFDWIWNTKPSTKPKYYRVNKL